MTGDLGVMAVLLFLNTRLCTSENLVGQTFIKQQKECMVTDSRVYARSLVDCAARCGQSSQCRSVCYNTSDTKCSINSNITDNITDNTTDITDKVNEDKTAGSTYRLVIPPQDSEDAHQDNEDANQDNEDAHQDNEDAHQDSEDAHRDSEDAHRDNEDAHQDNEDAHRDNDAHQDTEDAHQDTEDAHRDNEDVHQDNEDAHQTRCGEPPDVANADRKEVTIGTYIYSCREDFVNCMGRTSSTCDEDTGQWQDMTGLCAQSRWKVLNTSATLPVPCALTDRLNISLIGTPTGRIRWTVYLRGKRRRRKMNVLSIEIYKPDVTITHYKFVDGGVGTFSNDFSIPPIPNKQVHLRILVKNGKYPCYVNGRLIGKPKEIPSEDKRAIHPKIGSIKFYGNLKVSQVEFTL